MKISFQKFPYAFLDFTIAAASVGSMALGYSISKTLAAAGAYCIARKIQNIYLSRVLTAEAASPQSVKSAVPETPQKDRLGSSPWKYLAIAFLVAIAAAECFAFSTNMSIFLSVIAVWCLNASMTELLSYAFQDSEKWAAKGLRWLRAMIAEIHSGLAAAVLLLFTTMPQFNEPAGNLNGRPILMVNGYLSFGSTWYYLRKRLAKAGFGPIYIVPIGSFDSIENNAGEVQNQVKKIQAATGRKDLCFICHSKGGLVGAYYATHLARADGAKVTEIVTIASPLAGTPIAKLGVGKDAEEMRPEHPFHLNLRKEIEKHPEIRFFQIASETDEIVPFESALIATELPSQQRVFKDLGHLNLLFSSKTADQISTWLKGTDVPQ